MAFHIARNNQKLGVFDDAEVEAKLASGELRAEDLCWKEGMADWAPLGETVDVTADRTPAAMEEVEEPNPYSASEVDIPSPAGDPLASLGERLGAALIDGVLFAFGYLPAVLAMDEESGDLVNPSMGLLGLSIILGLLVVNIVMLARRGQTIGKRLVGIRIVGLEDDRNPGAMRTIFLRSFVNGLLGLIPFYAIVDILFIFGPERRCIHDLIASTRVVQGQPRL